MITDERLAAFRAKFRAELEAAPPWSDEHRADVAAFFVALRLRIAHDRARVNVQMQMQPRTRAARARARAKAETDKARRPGTGECT